MWSTGAVLFGHVMRLGGNLVLARMLMPEVFGVMAIVITIGVVVNLLSDIGLHQSIVRHPVDENDATLISGIHVFGSSRLQAPLSTTARW